MPSDDVPRTIRLGDVDVPRIGLGTNRLQHTSGHAALVRDIVAAGIRHIDTAHLYTGGASEQAIGDAGPPTDVVVATKGGYRPGEGADAVLRAQIEQSLRHLRTDRIALYYLHRVDPQTPLEDSLRTIAGFVERGLIAHVGLSEVDVEQIERAREIVPVTAVQNEYNLGERRHEAVIDHCAREGIVFVPFFPVRDAGGRELQAIAERHGATPAQIALAWLLRRSPAMLPIPGTLSLEHAQQNLAALDIELGDAEFEALRSGGES